MHADSWPACPTVAVTKPNTEILWPTEYNLCYSAHDVKYLPIVQNKASPPYMVVDKVKTVECEVDAKMPSVVLDALWEGEQHIPAKSCLLIHAL